MADGPILDVAATVADGLAVDWGAASQTLGSEEDRQLLDRLRQIADVTAERRSALGLTVSADGPLEADLSLRQPANSDVNRWGPLQILERVGSGMFGDVYRAWDSRLDREVALKILRRTAAGRTASTVIDEGRLLARVRHPNIVTVYGADTIDGTVGVWMELVHGSTLESELTRHGPFTAESVIDIGVTLADALAAVHRGGVLHRDVKAQNVMRDSDGRLLLTDFGAGHRFDSERARVIGTPLYAAPEVLAGHPATRQSDIYSLGVLLFRLATSSYPINGRTLEEVRAAHVSGSRTSLRDARPELPPSLGAIIERALQPDPGQRFALADELRDRLAALVEGDPHRSSNDADAARRYRRLALAVVAALALSGATAFLYWQQYQPPVSIAVLPLDNLGSEPDSDVFADGLTDELIRRLATIHGLDVRSRTSSFVFKDRPRNVREAGRQLRATLLLEGSLRRSGDRIRINVRLVRADDDSTIWAGKFDHDITAVLAIQDEIARSIVGQLRLTLDERSRRRYDIDVATYERYLRARVLSERKDRESLRTAIAFYKEVVATEPAFAPAYAGLADAYADLEFWGNNYETAYLQIKAAASKALELDPGLPEAHAAMGLAHARDRQWALADRAFQRSIAINPNLSRIRTAYAHWYLFQTGQLDRALEELTLALAHDPLSLYVRRVIAYVQISAERYEAALENCRYVLNIDPKFPLIGLVRARALLLTGEVTEALDVLEAMPPNRAPELGYTYAVTGRRAEAEALAAEAAGVPLTQAVIYAGLRENDRAFAALERAAALGDPKIGGVLTYPELTALRGDQRFEEFRRRVGLGTKAGVITE